jgi:hypothetical protein
MAGARAVPVRTLAFGCAERRPAYLRALWNASLASYPGKSVNNGGHSGPGPVTVSCPGSASVNSRAIYAAP